MTGTILYIKPKIFTIWSFTEKVCQALLQTVENPYAHILLHLKTSLPNLNLKSLFRDFPGGAVVKNLPANAGDTGSIPGLGISHMPWSN